MPISKTDHLILNMTKKQRARFRSNIIVQNGCWPWTGPLRKAGYGIMSLGQNGQCASVRAHRVLLILRLGETSPLQANHACNNPACVRPGGGHVYLGTTSHNSYDSVRAGTHASFVRNYETSKNAKLNERMAKQCFYLYFKRGLALRDIAHRLNISASLVSSVVNGNNWGRVLPKKPLKRRQYQISKELVGELKNNSKLTNAKVKKIRSLVARGQPQTIVAQKFNIDQSTVSVIVNRKTWRHI